MTQRRIIGATALALTVLIVGAAVEAVPQIERRLEASVSDLLVRNGASWASVAVDGRTVTLTGVPISHEARLSVVALVRRVPGVSEVKPLVSQPIGLRTPDREVTYQTQPKTNPGGSVGGEQPTPGAAQVVPETRLAMRDGESTTAEEPSEPTLTEAPAPRITEQAVARVDEEPAPTIDEEATPGASPPVRVARESCATRLTRFAQERTLAFEPREALIAERDKSALVQTAEALRGCREWTLTLVAYAGENEGANSWALADQRAYAVARFFMSRGVDESRLATVTGNGSSNDDDFARVEIFVSGGM